MKWIHTHRGSVPIYSAELSPEHIRGAILANWQLADAAGEFDWLALTL